MRINCVFVAQDSERAVQKPAPAGSRPKFFWCLGTVSTPRSTTETPQPVAALVEPPDWTWAHVASAHDQAGSTPLVVVLAGLQDPGNLGTILRSAEAFGATGVISLPGTVSAWNPKGRARFGGQRLSCAVHCRRRARVS